MKRLKKNKFDSVFYICEDNLLEEELLNNDNIFKEGNYKKFWNLCIFRYVEISNFYLI